MQAVANYMKPDPLADKAFRLLLREQNESNQMQAEMVQLPAKMLLMAQSPAYSLFVISNFILRTLIERVDSDKNFKK